MAANGVAYVVIPGAEPGKRIGIVKVHETGYYPAEGYDVPSHKEEQVEQFVDELNTRMGIPKDVAESMRDASMFGWHTLAARKAVEFWREQVNAKA